MAVSFFIDQIPTKTTNLSGNELLIIEDNNTYSVSLSTIRDYVKSSTGGVSKFTAVIGDGSSKVFTISHNFGTREVVTSLYNNTTFRVVSAFIENTTTNFVSVSFVDVPSLNDITATIIG